MQHSTGDEMTPTVESRLAVIGEWQDANPLRMWRREHDLSMRQAAPLIGTNFNSIQDWEQGQYDPSPDSMAKIVAATGIADMSHRWTAWRSQQP